MNLKTSHNGLLTRIPPWIFIGAAIILLPIFTFMTLQTVKRQQRNHIQLLKEKGTALIRSFEAGTRTGMTGMRGGSFRLQQLLTETALQDDIVYLQITDAQGTVLAHNDPEMIHSKYGTELNLAVISESEKLNWRIIDGPQGSKVFEVFRKFSPMRRTREMPMGHRLFQLPFRPERPLNRDFDAEESALIIFIGLDTRPFEAAHRDDIRHAVVMGIILLLVGFAGVILLFLAQSYRATRQSLSRVQAFSDNLVENMPIGLIALDTQKRIASINHVAGTILSLSIAHVTDKEAKLYLPRELLDLIDQTDDKEGVVEAEIECLLGRDRTIPLEASASILKDENGNFHGHVLLLRDLTEVRALHKEIAKNQRLVTVGRLAAGVAHEIRNPLSSIKGFATYFKERYRTVPEDQHIAGIMIQEVDRLNRVVGQLLEFSRPISLTPKKVSMKVFLLDSLKLIEKQAQDKNIRIETSFAFDQDSVELDSDKMSQVLLNLYLNAIEAMGENGGVLQIGLDENQSASRVRINITDDGVGIAESDLAHIFDPYFTTKSSGTGLGLAIVHKILEVHRGEIFVASKPGEGTTVTIELPYTSIKQD